MIVPEYVESRSDFRVFQGLINGMSFEVDYSCIMKLKSLDPISVRFAIYEEANRQLKKTTSAKQDNGNGN